MVKSTCVACICVLLCASYWLYMLACSCVLSSLPFWCHSNPLGYACIDAPTRGHTGGGTQDRSFFFYPLPPACRYLHFQGRIYTCAEYDMYNIFLLICCSKPSLCVCVCAKNSTHPSISRSQFLHHRLVWWKEGCSFLCYSLSFRCFSDYWIEHTLDRSVGTTVGYEMWEEDRTCGDWSLHRYCSSSSSSSIIDRTIHRSTVLLCMRWGG